MLVIRGDVGVGKSALLAHARARATGMRVIDAAGVESEAQLPFAALHQVVRPVLGLVDRIPEPQAGALGGALGLGSGGRDDRFLVSLAALTLLAEAAEQQPLLCLVDDAHWLDDASADALVFVARRLQAEGVVLLFAAREGEARRFDAPGLPELRLGGLGADAAAALLDRHVGAALPPDARRQLIEATGGNPLALLELPSVLTPDHLSGAEPLFDPVPVGARVERAFLDRARRLPGETQTLLLVAAADDTCDLSIVLRAAASLGCRPDALDAAEQAGLLHVAGPRIAFSHPVVRSAVYHGAVLSKRQAAHRALADALDRDEDADRRAWHRAAASVRPDPPVADALERTADRARRRSGFAAASLALERAAALTTEEGPRVRRLSEAATTAWLAGRAERTLTLLHRARPLVSEPTQLADVDRLLGLIEMTSGSPADAGRLVDAAADVAPVDAERALETLTVGSVASVYAGDRAAAVAIPELARRLAVADTPASRMLVQLLVGLGAFFEGDFARASTGLRVALAREAEQADGVSEDQPVTLLFAGRAALFLGDDDAVHRTHQAAAAQARAAGALSLLTQILPRLAYAELCAGRWAAATASAREGLQLAREFEQHDLVAYQLAVLALVAAHRGDEDECRSLAAEARGLAAPRGFALVAEFAHWALALLELGLGRTEAALRRARDVSATGAVYWAGLDRLEAAVRAGEQQTARRWLGAFEPWASSALAAWPRAVALHGRALLAGEPGECEALFRDALAAHAQATRPFERARTELAFGAFLRRNRRRVEAREHLRGALDNFESLGAERWAERARGELRASGQTARRRDPSTRDELTPQELQVVRFVAQGLSNQEVAAQLFLSPRTVAFRLRNVFRKLGISSRTELARLQLEPTTTPVRHGSAGPGR